MKGTYRIRVQAKKVIYDFMVRRNITIVTGESAKGKTTLIDYISDYYNYGKDSGINLICDKSCIVLSGINWKQQLRDIRDSIVFIDEGNKFISSVEFAHAVKNSDNYYVIVTRERLANLPYSINEIYGITDSGKYANVKQVYNCMYNLYGEYSSNSIGKPTLVITEDKKAGCQFFENAGEKLGFKCVSADGKANVLKSIMPRTDEEVLLVVDGAAFGPEMNSVMNYIKRYPNYTLYAPESFEWLLLRADIFRERYIADILSNPSDFIDSSSYFSWERYFTDLLEHISHSYKGYEYSKDKLSDAYLQDITMKKILDTIENINFDE